MHVYRSEVTDMVDALQNEIDRLRAELAAERAKQCKPDYQALAARIIETLDAVADYHARQTDGSRSIRTRYAELKRTMDFLEAGRQARIEGVVKILESS